MKDQYFGDVNDFRKYGLLRAIGVSGGLQLGVCWMLTEADGRSDGDKRAYLHKPGAYRKSDPALFDWLKQVVDIEQDRRVARIESSNLLGPALFAPAFLTDGKVERKSYFSSCAALFSSCDLVFFDPDNGLEVESVVRGRSGSRKYLYWDEVCETFVAGSSVLIYQHFIRENRERFTNRIVNELRERTGTEAVFSFRTPHVLFVLASRERHAIVFRKRLASIRSTWVAKQIRAEEHLP